MVTEELITIIKKKYQQGERQSTIKESLMQEGWSEEDISVAITHIQKQALRQFPGIASVIHLIEKLDKKTQELPPNKIAAIMAGCAGLVLLVFIMLYMLLDPLGTRNVEPPISANPSVPVRTITSIPTEEPVFIPQQASDSAKEASSGADVSL